MRLLNKEKYNIDKIKIQKEEVEEVKWATIDEIKNMIRNNIFSESHTVLFEFCLEYLKVN